LISDRPACVDLAQYPCRTLLCRHRATVDEAITLITLTITLITLIEERVRWDRDAHDNTKLMPVRLGVAFAEGMRVVDPVRSWSRASGAPRSSKELFAIIQSTADIIG
jgi:hypothetical protein